jgi:hypothetical protein
LPQAWAGVDIGKAHHHVVVIDSDGKSGVVIPCEPFPLTAWFMSGGAVLWQGLSMVSLISC